ncbi:nuclear transcription factor Y subunit A-3-like [Chenopodium quinoa]|uniref:Nuclear transcription factor Y subunit n=1 Tax=Chenopodium quinoa TaxID=63459 RepID=A0A803KR46_CHEQI|nr:nuclear transcription factor Y subunit A-3-like [Chenopodium quinoa]XP_021720492.1 nuclear transcription factor Y subunit A-3-like [Chenopodium quinoa]
MGVPAQRYQGAKLLDFSFQDQDSCSTQSTGQSYTSSASFGENDLRTQSMSFAQSGYNTHGKHESGEYKFNFSMGTQDYTLPPLQTDFNQAVPQFAVTFPDQHYNSVMSTYAPQAVMVGIMPARVPLPLDFSASDPIYVNAKQYHGILRRRQHRAKLEAQNKLAKNRKPYLHESRHQHALKRTRGSGGRFLNMKKLQESNTSAQNTKDHNKVSGAISLHLAGKASGAEVRQQENHREGTSTTSCSDVTSTSNSDDIYHPLEFRFSNYSSGYGEAVLGGGSAENYI